MFGEGDEALGRVGAAVEEHVLDALQQIGRDLLIDAEHAGVDDRHVEAGVDRMVQKRGMHRFAHRVVAAERERDVGYAAAHLGAGEGLFEEANGLKEIDGVIIVFLHAGGDGEDIRVEDDVGGRETEPVDQQAVGPRADADPGVAVGGLALLVERHDDRSGAVTPDELRAPEKLRLAVLQREGVDDAPALQAFQAGLEHAPFGAVDHEGDPGDFGLGGDEVEELRHRGFAVEQRLVDVDIEDIRPALDLLARNRQRGVPVAGLDGLGEFRGSGDVGSFTDDQKAGGVAWHHGRRED